MYSAKKYNTILYNKEIQRKLGLYLIDFKRFSGRYKVESNNITKEYNSYNHNLIYMGQYSNGKRNGNGKEYDEDGKLILEGEYLDGKKWKGNAKKYDEDTGKLILEFEYLKGKIEGKVKEYDRYNGDLLFSRYYIDGKRSGQGTEYKSILYSQSDNRYSQLKSKLITIFSGEYINGERKEGKEYDYDENLIYEGEYLNGKKNGKGKIL